MNTTTNAMLAASVAALRTAYSPVGNVDADPAAGVIRNCAVMSVGGAKGWGFEIDAVTLSQVKELVDGNGGDVKVRWTHPEWSADGVLGDGTGTQIGVLRNLRIEGDVLRGDVYLGEYAKCVPGEGDIWSYLMPLVKERPQDIGLSAVFSYGVDESLATQGKMVARVGDVMSVDFVECPAANDNGLLSERTIMLTGPDAAAWIESQKQPAKPGGWQAKFDAALAEMKQPGLKVTAHRVVAALNRSRK